jgi:uncharacterized protein YegP (UPF0339 family)
MAGKYILHPAGDAQFHWDLKGANARTILSSQLYAAKASAESGIKSCRANSGDDARYERLVAKDSSPYFVLKAANGEIIATSQMYSSESARDQGIASCRENGPAGAIHDTTVK